jgi:hypothetical protein
VVVGPRGVVLVETGKYGGPLKGFVVSVLRGGVGMLQLGLLAPFVQQYFPEIIFIIRSVQIK